MYTVLFYDISSDRIRFKVSETCLDYGLDREQFSAFIGNLTRSQQVELMHRLTALLGNEPGAILLLPINSADWERRLHLANARPAEIAASLSVEVPRFMETPDDSHPF